MARTTIAGLALGLLCMPPMAAAASAYADASSALTDETASNDAAAAAAMLRLAESGDVDAQAYMVHVSLQGLGMARDEQAAARWEARALAQPEAESVRGPLGMLRGAPEEANAGRIMLELEAAMRESARIRKRIEDNARKMGGASTEPDASAGGAPGG